MKAMPGFVPSPAQQSVWAPLISGIGSAAGGLMKAEIGGAFGNASKYRE
jgi:hypothetical protein